MGRFGSVGPGPLGRLRPDEGCTGLEVLIEEKEEDDVVLQGTGREYEGKLVVFIAPPVPRERLDEANDKLLRCIVTDFSLSYK